MSVYCLRAWCLGGQKRAFKVDWRDGSGGKSTDCSSRGSEFKSQQPPGVSQPSVMGSDAPSSGVSEDSYNVLIYINKSLKKHLKPFEFLFLTK